jgi:hypothetical protein
MWWFWVLLALDGADGGFVDESNTPIGPAQRTRLISYLRKVNSWVGATNVAENNLTCRSAGPDCGVTDYIFINGNMARLSHVATRCGCMMDEPASTSIVHLGSQGCCQPQLVADPPPPQRPSPTQARGLIAGHSVLGNQTELDMGLQWCDTFVRLAYNTTASDGTHVQYWDSGYGSGT